MTRSGDLTLKGSSLWQLPIIFWFSWKRVLTKNSHTQYEQFVTKYRRRKSLDNANKSIGTMVNTSARKRISANRKSIRRWYSSSTRKSTNTTSVSTEAAGSSYAPHPPQCFDRLRHIPNTVSWEPDPYQTTRTDPWEGNVRNYKVLNRDRWSGCTCLRRMAWDSKLAIHFNKSRNSLFQESTYPQWTWEEKNGITIIVVVRNDRKLSTAKEGYTCNDVKQTRIQSRLVQIFSTSDGWRYVPNQK